MRVRALRRMNGTVWQYWIASDGTLSAMTPVPATPGQFPATVVQNPAPTMQNPRVIVLLPATGPMVPSAPLGMPSTVVSGSGPSTTDNVVAAFPVLGVAVDGVGNVYVADSGGNRVVKAAPDGTQTTLGSGFSNPCGVAVDSAGNVYVADTNNKRVVKVAPGLGGAQTTVGSGWGTPNAPGPADVAVDPPATSTWPTGAITGW